MSEGQRWARLLVAGVALIGVAACGASKPSTFTVSGSMRITGYDDTGTAGIYVDPSGLCFGVDGFADIKAGAQIVVKDATGRAVATGALGPGDGVSNACTFKFKIPDVPSSGDSIYSIEVSHRGDIAFKKADAAALSLTIG